MDPITMALLSGGIGLGGGLLQQLFGGRKAGYQMSPDEKKVLGELWGKYEGPLPSHVTDPFFQQAKDIKQHYKRMPGSSGTKHAVLQRQAYTPMAEAGSRYKQGLLGQIQGLTKGTGTQTATGGVPWGDILGGAGEDFGFLWALQQMLKSGGQTQGVIN